jgi:hypothetical protein
MVDTKLTEARVGDERLLEAVSVPVGPGLLRIASRVRAHGRPAIEINADGTKKPFFGGNRDLEVVTANEWEPSITAVFVPLSSKETARQQPPNERMTAKRRFFAEHQDLKRGTKAGEKAWREAREKATHEQDSLKLAAWLKKGGAGETAESAEIERLWAEHKAQQTEKRSQARRKSSAIRVAILGEAAIAKRRGVAPAPKSGSVLIVLDKVDKDSVPRVISAQKGAPVSIRLKEDREENKTRAEIIVRGARDKNGREGKISAKFDLPARIVPVLIEKGEKMIGEKRQKEKRGGAFVLPAIGASDLGKINWGKLDKKLLAIPAALIPLVCLAGLLATSGRGGEVPTSPTLTVSPTPVEAFTTSEPVIILPTPVATPTPFSPEATAIPALPSTGGPEVVIVTPTPAPPTIVPPVDAGPEKPEKPTRTPPAPRLPAGIACQPMPPGTPPEVFAPPAGWFPNSEMLESAHQPRANFQNAVFDKLCVDGLTGAIRPDGTLDPVVAGQVLNPDEIRTWNGNIPYLDRFYYFNEETGQRDERGDSFGPKPEHWGPNELPESMK